MILLLFIQTVTSSPLLPTLTLPSSSSSKYSYQYKYSPPPPGQPSAVQPVTVGKEDGECRYCNLCHCGQPSDEDGQVFSAWIQRQLYGERG